MSFYRYARHSDIADYEMHGWRYCCDLRGHHGVWSVLMEYVGGGVGP